MSPVAVIAVVLMLLRRRSSASGAAFTLGWAAGLTSIAVIVLTFAGSVGVAMNGKPSPLGACLRLLASAGLFGLGCLQWHKRPTPGSKPDPPPWMNSMEAMQPLKALETGAVLSALSPKNVMLTLAAAL